MFEKIPPCDSMAVFLGLFFAVQALGEEDGEGSDDG